tara:strand:+ start:465 stop:587 length:123 start_codon:yes stop_codon:yes gene_type:complete
MRYLDSDIPDYPQDLWEDRDFCENYNRVDRIGYDPEAEMQ